MISASKQTQIYFEYFCLGPDCRFSGGSMRFTNGIYCEAEDSRKGKEIGGKVGKCVAIQIWSPDTVKAISSNFSDGSFSPG